MKRSALITISLSLLVLIGNIAFAEIAMAENSNPVAVIDGTLNVTQGKTVYLDGTFSSDPDGDTLSYAWALISKPDGSIASISSSSDSQASFDADIAGTYRVRLVVSDGFIESAPAYAEIIVTGGQ